MGGSGGSQPHQAEAFRSFVRCLLPRRQHEDGVAVDVVLFGDIGQRLHPLDDLAGLTRLRVVVRMQDDVSHVERTERRNPFAQAVERDEGEWWVSNRSALAGLNPE